METLSQIYSRHMGTRGGGDKGTLHSYIPVYEEILRSFRTMPGNVIELGVFRGDSMRMWEEYFTCATVYGAELCEQPVGGMADLRPMIAEGVHKIVLCNVVDPVEVDKHFRGMEFNVIIDDASHVLEYQVAAYHNFKANLAPGGVYIIEDVQDIDNARQFFTGIDINRRVEIHDLRNQKGRYDDVLVVIR